jgi:hypothetical protein
MSTIVLSLDKPNEHSSWPLLVIFCLTGAFFTFAVALSSPELAETLSVLN